MNIAAALNSLCPGAQWSLSGDDLAGLVWHDKTIAQPAPEAITTEIARLAALWEAKLYVRERIAAYPSVTALADALVHQANGDDAPMAAYVAACNAVKAKYPKPS